MYLIKSILFFWLFTFCGIVQADTLLLLHGYLGSPHDWIRTGIVKQLDQAGWRDAGLLQKVDAGVSFDENTPSSTRRLYNLGLESEKAIHEQAIQLHTYVQYVRLRHPGEQIILVGHSAGGVVARLYMVEQQQHDLIALITIASPHLGTDKAELLALFSQGLLAWFEPFPGINKLYNSQGLLYDLIPNRSDNLIGWLNYQEHPAAEYYSVVRDSNDEPLDIYFPLQDFIVPTWSQDMNQVHALRGRCKTYKIKSMHNLTKQDGDVLQRILISLYSI